jgi:hypothetical protein
VRCLILLMTKPPLPRRHPITEPQSHLSASSEWIVYESSCRLCVTDAGGAEIEFVDVFPGGQFGGRARQRHAPVFEDVGVMRIFERSRKAQSSARN